jgi:hypothetical protein
MNINNGYDERTTGGVGVTDRRDTAPTDAGDPGERREILNCVMVAASAR